MLCSWEIVSLSTMVDNTCEKDGWSQKFLVSCWKTHLHEQYGQEGGYLENWFQQTWNQRVRLLTESTKWSIEACISGNWNEVFEQVLLQLIGSTAGGRCWICQHLNLVMALQCNKVLLWREMVPYIVLQSECVAKVSSFWTLGWGKTKGKLEYREMKKEFCSRCSEITSLYLKAPFCIIICFS